MLRKLTFGEDNVLAYRWEGKFDKKAFDQAMEQFVPDFKTHDQFNVYVELIGFEGIEAGAVWKDVKFYIGNLKEFMTKIDKVALVTDNSWIKNLSETSYKLIPGIELKSYKFDEKEVAKQWVVK